MKSVLSKEQTMVLKKISTLLLVYFLVSCSHMTRSGQYVEIVATDSLQSLSREFSISEHEIMQANPGLNFRAGAWIFIPTTAGILNAGKSKQRSPALSTEDHLDSGRFIWPVPSSKRISSPFGPRWGRHHDGIDIPGRPGTNILAADDGIVVYSGNALGGYGNIVVLSHEGGFFSVYAHNQKNKVRRGQRIHRGQVVALLGSTGHSTGPHLHFEIRRDSRPIDPKKLVSMR
jgi:murein DD-endopeptidase MepM/ murein hydrolase activator NlpD